MAMDVASADAVFAVFNRGLALRDRLEVDEPLNWDLEQGVLKQLLSAFVMEADENLESLNELDFVFSEQGSAEERGRLTYATIRYALTCWLDEWFTKYSTPASPGRERTLEVDLFGGNEGSAKFWDEGRYAETRGDLDALEAMYLCVMLGFRGTWADKPEQLAAWATRIRARLAQAAPMWTTPVCLQAPRYESPQAYDLPYRRMLFSVLLTFSLMLPLVLILLWRI